MGESVAEDGDLMNLKSHLCQANIMWKQELERHQSQVDILQAKLLEVKASILCSEEDAKRELEILWRTIKTTSALLTCLKSKAKIMAVPHLTIPSSVMRHEDDEGHTDKNSNLVTDWSRDVDFSGFGCLDKATHLGTTSKSGSSYEHDASYIGEILKSVRTVTDLMEALIKRVIMAEKETAIEKEKVNLGQEEIKKKALQIESMSAKVEEMERFASGTNSILNEMRQKVEDMVQETTRQRQRAAENEQELFHVKQDFESLRSYVSSLISVRETLLSSEKQFQTMEKLFERFLSLISF
ncbi:hypothetical protein ACLOJK_027923 [Asimina triloba]